MSHNNRINLIDTIKRFSNYEVDTNGNIYSLKELKKNKCVEDIKRVVYIIKLDINE